MWKCEFEYGENMSILEYGLAFSRFVSSLVNLEQVEIVLPDKIEDTW
jgi:hypothetical protein